MASRPRQSYSVRKLKLVVTGIVGIVVLMFLGSVLSNHFDSVWHPLHFENKISKGVTNAFHFQSSVENLESTRNDTLKQIKAESMVDNSQSPRGKISCKLEDCVQSRKKATLLEPMAMALGYWEQMGNAGNNLYDLQCWASTVGIAKVLEPFVMQEGEHAFHFRPFKGKPPHTFRDLFDIDAWNKMSLKHSFASLVPLKTFLDNAIKEIVYVQIIYTKYPPPCTKPMSAVEHQGWYQYLAIKGFKLIHTVCVNFGIEPGNIMTAEAFQDRIFSQTGRNVSLVFSQWRGVRNFSLARMPLKGSRCYGQMYKMAYVETMLTKPQSVTYVHTNSSSPLVLNHTLSGYVNRFRREFMQGSEYVAVMLRTERLKSNFWSTENNSCVDDILSDWKLMKTTGIQKTLYFCDANRHGSQSVHKRQSRIFSDHVQHLLHLEHGLNDVNHYFENTTGYKNGILIAAMHREIVAQAKCVIVVGGGDFQRQTLNLFAHYHRGEELCYSFRNSDCMSEYIYHVYDDT